MENLELKKQNEELKLTFEKEINELKNQIKDLMNKNCKIHYKTLQKINNQQNTNQNNIKIIYKIILILLDLIKKI